jgi:hypothetical protein
MNVAAEREARAEMLERRRRYLSGDGADWFEMFRRGQATEDEVFTQTGFTIASYQTVAVPVEQFARISGA